jgi:hypothetical protein
MVTIILVALFALTVARSEGRTSAAHRATLRSPAHSAHQASDLPIDQVREAPPVAAIGETGSRVPHPLSHGLVVAAVLIGQHPLQLRLSNGTVGRPLSPLRAPVVSLRL